MITLVLGGARSGKSEFAERLTNRLPIPVAYLATALIDPHRPDPDLAARIETHRARRPPQWLTVEAGSDLVAALGAVEGSALIDSLGPWVAGAHHFEADVAGLCEVLEARDGDTVVVSEEVGLGVHPSTEIGRKFRDALGMVNQAVADIADEVILVVAGRPLALGPRAFDPSAG